MTYSYMTEDKVGSAQMGALPISYLWSVIMNFIDDEVARIRIKKAMDDARANGKDETLAMRTEIGKIRRETCIAKAQIKNMTQQSLLDNSHSTNIESDNSYPEPVVANNNVNQSSVFNDPNFSADMTNVMSGALAVALSSANRNLTDPDLFRSSLRFDMDRMHHTLSEILNELRKR